MGKAKEILRLHRLGLSYRDIAGSTGCGKTVVGETIRRAKEVGILDDWEQRLETELELLLYAQDTPPRVSTDEPDISLVLVELARPNMTRQLLWEEYRIAHPGGLMYSQFCDRIRQALKADRIDYHKPHPAGQECEVDWAGTTIPYFDMDNRCFREAHIFVAVLPASNYPFLYAYENEQQESFVDGHIRAFECFGGTPRILIPDCVKTAVTKTDRFDPLLNKSYREMAAYYDITIVPARPRKPKDKNMVENAVGNISRRILARMRDMRFTRLEQINQTLAVLLAEFREEPFQKLPGCRRSTFEQIEKSALKPLPNSRYELALFHELKIGTDYHVPFEGFCYSVPFEHRGKPCTVRSTPTTIEIFVTGERISVHQRRRDGERYVTRLEHMPEQHKVVSVWNKEAFLDWAANHGDHTVAFVGEVFRTIPHSVAAYRVCMGVAKRAGTATAEEVDKACALALDSRQFTSRYFELALARVRMEVVPPSGENSVVHSNIRGAKAFSGGNHHA